MEINDEDIQVLMKITLLTPTNKKIKVVIPYLKKFCPTVQLLENVATFIPIFHTLEFIASFESQQEKATIDLSPLIENPNHQHYLNVQTYSTSTPQKIGSRYSLHLEFAQMIVKTKEPNYMEVVFKTILLKLVDQKSKQMRPFLRVAISHGSNWKGKERTGNQLINSEESTTIVFQSLLDTVNLQLYNEKSKLCECKHFVFQLISEGSKVFEMQGELLKKASIKVNSRPSLPIVIIE